MNPALNGLHPTVAAYIENTNRPDPAAFLSCFEADAVVDDAGREWRGSEAIRTWSEREIFAPRVELEVLAVSGRGDGIVVTTRVEGQFDRTGLPDPVVVDHCFVLGGDKISSLTCRLVREWGSLTGSARSSGGN